jgi:hypothetical protein
MQMYCTFVLFVNQHFPGLPASGTDCTNIPPSKIYSKEYRSIDGDVGGITIIYIISGSTRISSRSLFTISMQSQTTAIFDYLGIYTLAQHANAASKPQFNLRLYTYFISP